MNPTSWSRDVWIGVLVFFLFLYILGERLIAWAGALSWAFPWWVWVVISLALLTVLIKLLDVTIEQFQKLYKDEFFQGVWYLVLAFAYYYAYYQGVIYVKESVVSDFFNYPLGGAARWGFAVLFVSIGLFMLQPTAAKIFGEHGLFAKATSRLTIIIFAALLLLYGSGGVYDYTTGDSLLYVDEQTGEYYFEEGKSPTTGNELKSCKGAKDILKEKCDMAAEKAMSIKKSASDFAEHWRDWMATRKAEESPSTTPPAPISTYTPPPPAATAPAVDPKCIYTAPTDKSVVGVWVFHRLVLDGCKEVTFVPIAWRSDGYGSIFFASSPCGATQRPVVKQMDGNVVVTQNEKEVALTNIDPEGYFFINSRSGGPAAITLSCPTS